MQVVARNSSRHTRPRRVSGVCHVVTGGRGQRTLAESRMNAERFSVLLELRQEDIGFDGLGL